MLLYIANQIKLHLTNEIENNEIIRKRNVSILQRKLQLNRNHHKLCPFKSFQTKKKDKQTLLRFRLI